MPTCLLTQARKKTTTNIGSRRIAIYNCNCNVKKEIKPPHWGGKLKKNSSGHPGMVSAYRGRRSPKNVHK
jgi:hypothetical protein